MLLATEMSRTLFLFGWMSLMFIGLLFTMVKVNKLQKTVDEILKNQNGGDDTKASDSE